MVSPYSKTLKTLDSISSYFKNRDDGAKIFIGKTLEIRIPSVFKKYDALIISDFVSTLGVFDMIIDDEYHCALTILGIVSIMPSDTGQMSYDNQDYTVLMLKTDDVFITNTKIIQDSHSIYIVWNEFITSGRLPYWFTYPTVLKIFEHARELTGSGIGVSRSVFEGIIAHLARDPDDVQKRYRLTDMTKPMKFIALNSISQATDNTTSRLVGAYFRDQGLTSALRYQVDQPQPFEQILRGISKSDLQEDSSRVP